MMISTGNIQETGRVQNSPSFNIFKLFVAFTLVLFPYFVGAQTITTKVYRPEGNTGNYYGKLHLPKGKKYKVAMFPREDVMVCVYRAYIDGANISLSSVDPYGKTYWIDATEVEQNFVVRNSDGAVIEAIPVTAEEDAAMETNGWFYFDRSDARKSGLKFNTSAISNETLRTQTATAGRPVYVMANPARRSLAFAYLDHEGSTREMPAGSLYIVGKAGTAARYLNIIFDDNYEIESTDIKDINTSEYQKDDNTIYTLQGVRITEPVKGTLYIRNGKKYIAR
jgi:hypothetical protein